MLARFAPLVLFVLSVLPQVRGFTMLTDTRCAPHKQLMCCKPEDERYSHPEAIISAFLHITTETSSPGTCRIIEPKDYYVCERFSAVYCCQRIGSGWDCESHAVINAREVNEIADSL
ncbi:hypothetical protein H2248_003840 [Termitomyces sp. 'cryptogamus']|nr:hypothetical protein H2248_003840 [Termitomyces sp. 'cryptogamus']